MNFIFKNFGFHATQGLLSLQTVVPDVLPQGFIRATNILGYPMTNPQSDNNLVSIFTKKSVKDGDS